MKLTDIKYLSLSLYIAILYCVQGVNLAVASTTYNEHYKVYNYTNSSLTNLTISDYSIYAMSATHDPAITTGVQNQSDVFPNSGPGGLASVVTMGPGGSIVSGNAWDISYCTPSRCYKSNISAHMCDLTDTSSGATVSITIGDPVGGDGQVTIHRSNDNHPCIFHLDQPTGNLGSPQWTEHYKVRNDSSVPVNNLVISDYSGLDGVPGIGYALYHDPVVTAKSLGLKQIAPSDGLGGLVSFSNLGPITYRYGWNGWDISYCTATTCYKSDFSVHVCSLNGSDIYDGSTAIVSIGDNGRVTIYTAAQGLCVFQLNTDNSNSPSN